MNLLVIFPRILNNESAFFDAKELFHDNEISVVSAVKQSDSWLPSNIKSIAQENHVIYNEYDTKHAATLEKPNGWSMDSLVLACDKLIVFQKIIICLTRGLLITHGNWENRVW